MRFNAQRFVPSAGKNWPQQLGIPNVAQDLLPSFGISGSGGLTGAGNAGLPESIYGLAVAGGFRDFMKTFQWSNITTAVDFQNPRTFGKVRSEPRTAEWGGQPIMHLTVAMFF